MKKLPALIAIPIIAISQLFSYRLLAASRANPMLHTNAGAVVTASDSPLLLRCVNLSPWLNREPYLVRKNLFSLFKSPSEFEQRLVELTGATQAQKFWQQWEDTFVIEQDFKHLSEQGFNCVRLPLNYKKISAQRKDGSVGLNEAGMAAVDRAVAWGKKYKIFVMINLHAAPGGQNNLATVADIPSKDLTARLWQGKSARYNQQQVIQIWQELAVRYAQATSVGGYNLLNEPNLPSGVPKNSLPRLYDEIISAIRRVDSNHMMILEGDDFSRDFSAFTPPTDQNIMYGFHEYSLFNPKWSKPSQKALEPFLKIRSAHNVPLWLSEFGEDNLNWQTQMVQLMKTNKIGWAIWPWKRVDLGKDRPVIQTIQTTNAWNKLADYLTSAPFSGRPRPAQVQQGMSDMLTAIRSANCREDQNLAAILSGSVQK